MALANVPAEKPKLVRPETKPSEARIRRNAASALVLLQPVEIRPNSSVAAFQATAGSRLPPGFSSGITGPNGPPLVSTKRPCIPYWMVRHAIRNLRLVGE